MQAGFYHEPVEVTIMTRSRETGGGWVVGAMTVSIS